MIYLKKSESTIRDFSFHIEIKLSLKILVYFLRN